METAQPCCGLTQSRFSMHTTFIPDLINTSISIKKKKRWGLSRRFNKYEHSLRSSQECVKDDVEMDRKSKGFLILIICGFLLSMLSLSTSSQDN